MKPSIRERISAAWAVLFNRYEAAQPFSPDRSWVPAFVRDARFDATSFSRWEMSRKIRYFERNVWLIQRLRDEFVLWTVGPAGLQIIPDSSDADWNARMQEDYLRWCENPCLDSTIDMTQVHRQLAGEHHLEGEVFIHETRRKLVGRPSEPAIQVIRGHRVSAPGQLYSPSSDVDGEGVIDGVQLGRDEAGQLVGPIGYHVRTDIDGTETRFRSTAVMQHVFDPAIPGMYRGITPYHAVLNTVGDLEDLEQMEMQRAKQNAEVANVLTNPTGEINIEAARQQRWGSAVNALNPNENELKARLEVYRRILGSRTVALRTGEKLEQFDSKTPSAATQWYWRYKIGQVCSAANVPLILIFPELIEGMQGTVVRGIYDAAHEYFRSKTKLFARAAIRMYRFRANWARYNITGLTDAPADWARCHVIPPRAVNVDIGYTTESTIAELNAGLTDYDTVAGSRGTTAEVIARRKAKQVAMFKRVAREVSQATGEEVRPEEIAGNLGDVLEQIARAEGETEPDADDPQPGKKTKEKAGA